MADVEEQEVVDEVLEKEVDVDEEEEVGIRGKLIEVVKILALLGLIAFLLAAFIIDFRRARAFFVCTCVVVGYKAVYFVMNKFKPFENAFGETFDVLVLNFLQKSEEDNVVLGGLSSVLLIIMAAIIGVEVRDTRNLISLLGLVVIVLMTWALSYKPTKVVLRPVIFSIFIQFIFGYIVISTNWGFKTVQFISDSTLTLLGFTDAGTAFTFGYLSDVSLRFYNFLTTSEAGSYNLGPPLTFAVLPTVIFFSAIIQAAYYLRIFPWIVKKIGYALSIALGTSASETLSAVANIFVGQTEAPLVVAPFIEEMTDSEIHAIMTGGFATIAGGVFGVYAFFLQDASAILAASIMSAPAALAISKIAYPETEESKTAISKKGDYDIPASEDVNVVHAAANGAITGTKLFINIVGNLIAALAIIAMLDAILMYSGERIDVEINFTIVCEYLFWPLAWLMGVDAEDCRKVGALLGVKIFANEFVAYEQLAFVYRGQISERSFYIASYALCGFANFGSVGIQLGGLGTLAPGKEKNLAKLALSAMFAGNTACLMTACIAGIFYKGS